MSQNKLSDAEFRATVDKIARGDNRDELMPAFLNERMAIDSTQVFRVLQLSNDMMNKPRK
jgi:hypothetical protein